MDLKSLSNEELIKYKKEVSFLYSNYKTSEQALKILCNSLYGSLGSPYFRFYDTEQAEAVTLTGQLIIQWVQKHVNLYLNKVLNTTNKDYVCMSDTDSLFFIMDDLVKAIYGNETPSNEEIVSFLDKVCKDKLSKYIQDKLNELMDYLNVPTKNITMVRDCIGDKILITAKKRYCLNVYDAEGIRYTEPKLKIMGIEVQRSSTPKICRERLKEAIKIIMTKDKETLIIFVENFKKEFKSKSPNEIAFPRSVNDLKTYSDNNLIYTKGTPIAVKGALIYNHYIKTLKLSSKYTLISDGDKIKFLYLKKVNPTPDKVISFVNNIPKEFNLEKYIDYDLQFEKTFLDPLKTIVSVIDWPVERRNTLESFFE